MSSPFTRAGEFTQLVTLQAPHQNTNGMGEVDQLWRDIWECHCKVMPTTGREILRNGIIGQQQTFLIRIQYRTDIQSNWRLKYRGRILEISNIENVREANIELELLAVESK